MISKNIERLYQIAAKQSRRIVGLMSGTSLDGLDIAVCDIKGSGAGMEIHLKHFVTVPYNDEFKSEIKSIFSKEEISLQKLCLLNEWVAMQHAEMVNKMLQEWKITSDEVDLVASHGQTIYHAPLSLHGKKKYGNGTLQIGDGDHLAVNTGIITLSDFRQKHIAAGGEGAPLAAYGDYLVFKEDEYDVILLNIGGIANFTFLPATGSAGSIFSTDTGPGNTLMDAWMQESFPGKFFDENAAVAEKGKVNDTLLTRLISHDFFKRSLPKTTGPELFNLQYLRESMETSHTESLNAEDVMATLNMLTAKTIVTAINSVLQNRPCKIFVSGGGMHNPVLLRDIKANVPNASFHSTMEKKINPDAKEALLFAILANECVSGDAGSFLNAAENFPAVSMGKISFPF